MEFIQIFYILYGVSALENANILHRANVGKFLQDVRDRKSGKSDAVMVTSSEQNDNRQQKYASCVKG